MEMEQTYVHDVYSEIFNEFDASRYSMWNFVKQFLVDKRNLVGLDVGCGNGKNMIYDNMHGIDTCMELILICKKRNKNVLHANCLHIPFRCNTFDYVISISVIHHLSSVDRQIQALNEIIRVLKHDGYAMVNFWSVENQSHSKRNFTPGDNMVGWKSPKHGIICRYYYIHTYESIASMIHSMDHIYNIRIVNEMGNWIVYFNKM